MQQKTNYKIKIGDRFGRLTVTSDIFVAVKPSGKRVYQVNCRCDCGKTKVIDVYSLLRKNRATKSCGCISKRFKQHGLSKHKHYNLWLSIKNDVDEEWSDVSNFIQWCENNFIEKYILSKINNKERHSSKNSRFISRAELFKQKTSKTNRNKYGSITPSKSLKVIEKMIQTKKKNGSIKTFHGKTMRELSAETTKAYTTFTQHVKANGFKKAIDIPKHTSKLTLPILDWLKQNAIKYIEEFYVDGKRADIFLPDKNVIIECDGIYWHSDAAKRMVNKNYHQLKRKKYIERGFTPFFFREDEINYKLDIVISIISNKLQSNQSYYARNTQFQLVNRQDGKNFLEFNHLMGDGQGKIYGLVKDGQLLTVMQIKKHGQSLEISRYCTLLHTSIVGGFSKLIKNIERIYNPRTIFSYVDLRYGSGDYLSSLGFQKKSEHLSFKWTDFKETYHRMTFPSNSGYKNGLAKIWDCGQAKFEKQYN